MIEFKKPQEVKFLEDMTRQELEAYRRAEETERLARERAQQIYTQANAVLAEVTLKAETASAQVAAAADQVTAKLQGTKEAFAQFPEIEVKISETHRDCMKFY